jgi:Ca-activated chloride channel family protein
MSSPPSEAVQVSAEFDRSLVWEKGRSVRYLAVRVTAPAAQRPAERTPLNLAIVIDASGSMSGPKLEAARQAALGLIAGLSSRDALAVVSFATEVTTHVPPRLLDEPSRQAALAAVQGLQPHDYTNLSGGWQRGAELVATHAAEHPGCHNRVLLLSDGHANRGVIDPRALGAEAEQFAGRGIYTSTVGIGNDYSSEQIEAIAVNGGGQLHRAETPGQVVEVVLGELSDVAGIVAESIAVTVEHPPTLDMELLGDFPATRQEGRVRCVLGSLLGATTRLAVFKVTVPAGPPGALLPLRVRVDWSPAGSREVRTETVSPILLRFAGEAENTAQPRQVELSVEVARVWQGAVLRRAVRLNRQGNYGEARRLLEEELRYFERYCAGLPQTGPLVAEMRGALDDIARAWDEGRRKEVEVRGWKQTRQERDHRSGQ